MPYCTIRNIGDIPLCISRPTSKEVLCILPGFTLRVRPEWNSVREAIHNRKASVVVEPPCEEEQKENNEEIVTVVV